MKLRNTLTSVIEELVPIVPGRIGIYVCGVTPYDAAHVGHAMSLIVYDVLVRYLRWQGNPAGGYAVTYVSNYTDVDDKLIDRGAMLGRDPLDIANENIAQWEAEQTRLGLLKPDVRPRVTQEIAPIIAMTQRIVDHGYAYVTPSGDVYYRVRAKADYGKLSHRNIEDLRTGTRFEPGEEKEFPLDFALWKAAKPGEPAWPSPWGLGRPGWHIECSAMSDRYLGALLDIHGGGIDLVFPHHENEVAQAEAATGGDAPTFARLWMHNGMVQRDGEKMSKSIGNVVGVAEALERWSPDAIRLYVLNSHYHAATNLTDEAMGAATAAVERLTRALEVRGDGSAPSTIDAASTRARFVEAMENDLGTPQALAALFDLVRDINRARDAGEDVRAAQDTLRQLTGVLGLALSHEFALRLEGATAPAGTLTLAVERREQRIERLVAERTEARGSRNFARADAIRDELDALGVTVEDTAQGPVVRPRR
ncbi:MAG: cysteine--tRNA ligase [Dehalococcoidia bacterium]|nr:cysteine--tRNA ligase [Dehalococcoidia bacterium]